MEFDKTGSLILPKTLKRVIKHEEKAFDDDDFFDNGLLIVLSIPD